MARIEEQVEIAAPSSDVFRLCHDIAKRPLWDERVGRIELITSAPIRSGTLIQVDERRGGNVFGWEGEYAEFKYPLNSRSWTPQSAAHSRLARSDGRSARWVTPPVFPWSGNMNHATSSSESSTGWGAVLGLAPLSAAVYPTSSS